jgi:hypothetical protein
VSDAANDSPQSRRERRVSAEEIKAVLLPQSGNVTIGRTMAYFKLIFGSLIFLVKVRQPNRDFWLALNAESFGYNLASFLIYLLTLWMIVSGVRGLQKRKS